MARRAAPNLPSRLIRQHELVLGCFISLVRSATSRGDMRRLQTLEEQLETLEKSIVECPARTANELCQKLDYLSELTKGDPYVGDIVRKEIRRLTKKGKSY